MSAVDSPKEMEACCSFSPSAERLLELISGTWCPDVPRIYFLFNKSDNLSWPSLIIGSGCELQWIWKRNDCLKRHEKTKDQPDTSIEVGRTL